MNEHPEENVHAAVSNLRAHTVKIAILVLLIIGPVVIAYLSQDMLVVWFGGPSVETVLNLVIWAIIIAWWMVALKLVLPRLSRRIDTHIGLNEEGTRAQTE
ncbi:MAG: hypothetical protein ACFFCK_08290 [Promethearchaeota archaeon]